MKWKGREGWALQVQWKASPGTLMWERPWHLRRLRRGLWGRSAGGGCFTMDLSGKYSRKWSRMSWGERECSTGWGASPRGDREHVHLGSHSNLVWLEQTNGVGKDWSQVKNVVTLERALCSLLGVRHVYGGSWKPWVSSHLAVLWDRNM